MPDLVSWKCKHPRQHWRTCICLWESYKERKAIGLQGQGVGGVPGHLYLNKKSKLVDIKTSILSKCLNISLLVWILKNLKNKNLSDSGILGSAQNKTRSKIKFLPSFFF